MATFTPVYGARQNLSVPTLHGLADGAFWQSDAFQVVDELYLQLYVDLSTTIAAGDADGRCCLWLAMGDSAGDLSGGASGVEGLYNPPSLDELNLFPLPNVMMKADAAIARLYNPRLPVNLSPLFEFNSIIVKNETGAALEASGNKVGYKLIKMTDGQA